MINKTCSIITDSNENYVGIVCEIDEIFMHVQIKNIMFVIPINRIKTVSYGLTHETDLGRRIESETEFSYEENPVYNSLVANEVNLFSNNTKELGIPNLVFNRYKMARNLMLNYYEQEENTVQNNCTGF